MLIKKITILVGSPGSGKSTLGLLMQNKGNGDTIFIDDISMKVSNNPIDYILEKSTLSEASHIVIADVNFCFTKIRQNAIAQLEKYFNVKIDVLYFENNLEKCLYNINYRFKNGDHRQTTELAKQISKKYSIPVEATILSIFSP